MIKFTPGPWRTGTRIRGRFVVSGQTINHRAICVMANTQKDIPDHELNLVADANARLIAASPSLYEVCKILIEDIEGNRELESVLKMAKEAVFLADGVNHGGITEVSRNTR